MAAKDHRDWPVRHDHCFARILLDCALDRPWREVVRPPAWANMPLADLRRAVEIGEAVLAGKTDLEALNARSLTLRGKCPPLGRVRRCLD
ncbi:MAG: GCN5-related N-acetyltransferase [Pseudomonadota bacterium]